MVKKEMTHDEKANNDKLEFYYSNKVIIHIVLNKKLPNGKNMFLNCSVDDRINDRLWEVNDRKLGIKKVSISDIAPWGIDEFKGDNRW